MQRTPTTKRRGLINGGGWNSERRAPTPFLQIPRFFLPNLSQPPAVKAARQRDAPGVNTRLPVVGFYFCLLPLKREQRIGGKSLFPWLIFHLLVFTHILDYCIGKG